MVSARTRNVVLFLLLGAALIPAIVFSSKYRGGVNGAEGVLDTVPADAQVIVWVNLSSIRTSPYREVFSLNALPDMVPGGGGKNRCGKNLTQRVSQLVLWTPADPGSSFGVAARAPVSLDSVWNCARNTIAARGGKPSYTDVEGFRIISDNSLGPGSAQIAADKSGMLFLARPTTRSRMMDALAGRTARATNKGRHAQMLEQIRSSEQQVDMTVTVIVGPPLRERIAAYLGASSPLLNDVEALAGTAVFHPDTHIDISVWCNTEKACSALEQGIEKKKRSIAGSIAMRAIGVSSLLDDARVSQQSTRVQIRLKAPAQQILRVIRKLEELEEAISQERRAQPWPAHSGVDENLRPASSR